MYMLSYFNFAAEFILHHKPWRSFSSLLVGTLHHIASLHVCNLEDFCELIMVRSM